MAQLFTVYFPNYCFEVQEEFAITFSNASTLPFRTVVSTKGAALVGNINFEEGVHKVSEYDKWLAAGLKTGLRICAVDGQRITKEIKREKNGRLYKNLTDHGDAFSIKEDIQRLLNAKGNREVRIKFIEHIQSIDEGKQLGLEYIESNESEVNIFNDEVNSGMAISVKDLVQNSPMPTDRLHPRCFYIDDDAIHVSSCESGRLPSCVRLNHPNSYWRPSWENERDRNAWIFIDLSQRRFVDKIQIQGSQDGSAHIKQLYLDYSNDGCEWTCHPMGKIKVGYVEPPKGVVTETDAKMQDNEEMKLNSPKQIETTQSSSPISTMEDNCTPSPLATIKIWPHIHAQFVRIRPWKWVDHVALRMELFGYELDPRSESTMGKIVTTKTVCPRFKEQLLKRLNEEKPDWDQETKEDCDTMQIDCKQVIERTMKRCGCNTYSMLDVDDNHSLLIFSTPDALCSERALDELTNRSVGQQYGVITTTAIDWRNASEGFEQKIREPDVGEPSGFYHSVKAHRSVRVVLKSITSESKMSFDYIAMVIIASCIAAAGLATNSSVIIVASMLVSPIMGPVKAVPFGVWFRKYNLALVGVRNELLSLALCVFMGFVVGFFWYLFEGEIDGEIFDIPSDPEMTGRGEVTAIYTGIFIASVSGLGVALAAWGDYMGTIVGVAISASLLPPAVNCGMLLALSAYHEIYPEHVTPPVRIEYSEAAVTQLETVEGLEVTGVPFIVTEGLKEWTELEDAFNLNWIMTMAWTSFTLTVVNIVAIWLFAFVMFWIKGISHVSDENERGKIWDKLKDYRKTEDPFESNLELDNDYRPLLRKKGVWNTTRNLLIEEDTVNDDDATYEEQALNGHGQSPSTNGQKMRRTELAKSRRGAYGLVRSHDNDV